MAKKIKDTFKAKDSNGKVVTVTVVKPGADAIEKADRASNKAFSQAILEGEMLLKAQLSAHLKKHNVWTEQHEKEEKELLNELRDCETKLAKGGINIQEARSTAIRMRVLRAKILHMRASVSELEQRTVESHAENVRFNTLVAMCLVNNKGEPYYKDVQEYLKDSDSEVAFEGATRLAQLIHGFDRDFDKTLPENKFLIQYGFVDDKLRLINEDGHFVDENYRLVDEQGFYVDEDGHRVDDAGNRIDESGNLANSEFQPFVDDDDKPVAATKTDKTDEEKPN